MTVVVLTWEQGLLLTTALLGTLLLGGVAVYVMNRWF